MSDKEQKKTPASRPARNRVNPNTKHQSRKQKKFSTWKKVLLGFIALILMCVIGASIYAASIISSIDPLDVDQVLTLDQPSQIYDSDGNFMDNLVSASGERYVISSDEIPDNLKNAFVSIEDERYYTHHGVDYIRLVGAMLHNVKQKLTGSSSRHGGSTITQQLIKNTILTNEQSIERKVKEAYLALSIEKQLTKDQIITAYLNTIPMGGQEYGVEAAALYYFNKNAKDLSLIECAYLAGINQAPSVYMAYSEANQKDPTKYINRTLTVLDKMLELGYISQSEHDEASTSVKNGGLVFEKHERSATLSYEWFEHPAIDQVKEDLKKKYNWSDEETATHVINGGYKIYTTMNKEIQDYAQEVLDNYDNLGLTNPETFDDNGVPQLQASATIVDYRNGEVIAMVGGRGKQPPQSTNRAYNMTRPIGSTTKPLTVYSPALNEKVITAGTPIDDAPLPDNTLNGGEYYNPSNSDHEYRGYMSARDALTYSVNTAAVIVEDKLGIDKGVEYGEKYGLKYNDSSRSSIAALALGQFNSDPANPDGGNTYTLAAAYGTFGNEGTYIKPKLYTRVENAKGEVILDTSEKEEEQILRPQTAYIMYDLLHGPVEKYSSAVAKWGDMDVAGKTGTTSSSTDLWFAGLTPYYSGSVWLGYDTPQQLTGGGSASCAKLWGMIMEKVHESLPNKEIPKPDGIVTETICQDSGLLPTSLCTRDPRGNRTYEEIFEEGTEPQSQCDRHVSVKVSSISGKLAGNHMPSFLTEEKIFITKDNPNEETQDYYMVLPTEYDNGDYSNYTNPNNQQNNNQQNNPNDWIFGNHGNNNQNNNQNNGNQNNNNNGNNNNNNQNNGNHDNNQNNNNNNGWNWDDFFH